MKKYLKGFMKGILFVIAYVIVYTAVELFVHAGNAIAAIAFLIGIAFGFYQIKENQLPKYWYVLTLILGFLSIPFIYGVVEQKKN